MIRCMTLAAALVSLSFAATAQDKKDDKKATVELFASLDDRELQKAMPANGVVASQKAWEKLAKDWSIKDPPKVDFTKEFLYVTTSVGSRISIGTGKLDDKGDFRIAAISTRDLRDGFRYAIKSFGREGVKTVNGKEMPKE